MKGGRVLLWGVTAGAIAVVLSFIARIFLGGTYLPELASSTVFSLVPGIIESKAVESLGPLAKESAFVISSALNAVVLGLIPFAIYRTGRLPQSRIRTVATFVALPYVVMLGLGALFLSLAQIASQPASLGSLLLSLVVPSLVFAAVLGFVRLTPRPAAPIYPQERMKGEFSKKRRLFIKGGVAAAVGAVLLYYGVGLLFSNKGKGSLTPTEEANQILAAGVTPNSEFYRVDVNVIAPTVNSSTWSLKLHGLVANPNTMSYSQLISIPSVEEYATLQCVSNVVGGDLMSTALWKGVRLKDVLRPLGVGASADFVVFRCSDGYDVGIPIDSAMMDGTILAYEMNGAQLPTEHGFPVRAIVPGLYGMMNAKWITEIELVSGTYKGFWQRRGWTNVATYQTSSTILTPGSGQLRDKFPLPGSLTDVTVNPVPVVGVAFAGDRGIKKVEVSTDRGSTWKVASMYDPLSKNTWVFWKLEWNPPASGDYQLMVRGTDGDGAVQVATMADPYPNGATGYDIVDVRVSNQ